MDRTLRDTDPLGHMITAESVTNAVRAATGYPATAEFSGRDFDTLTLTIELPTGPKVLTFSYKELAREIGASIHGSDNRQADVTALLAEQCRSAAHPTDGE